MVWFANTLINFQCLTLNSCSVAYQNWRHVYELIISNEHRFLPTRVLQSINKLKIITTRLELLGTGITASLRFCFMQTAVAPRLWPCSARAEARGKKRAQNKASRRICSVRASLRFFFCSVPALLASQCKASHASALLRAEEEAKRANYTTMYCRLCV